MDQSRSGVPAGRGDLGRGIEIIGLELARPVETAGRIGDGREMNDRMRAFKQRAQLDGADIGFDELVAPDRGKIEQRRVALSHHVIQHDDLGAGKMQRQLAYQGRADVPERAGDDDFHACTAPRNARNSA